MDYLVFILQLEQNFKREDEMIFLVSRNICQSYLFNLSLVSLFLTFIGTSMGVINSKKQIMYMDSSCTQDKCTAACIEEDYYGWSYCSNKIVCNCDAYVDGDPTLVDDTKQADESGQKQEVQDDTAKIVVVDDDSTEVDRNQEQPEE